MYGVLEDTVVMHQDLVRTLDERDREAVEALFRACFGSPVDETWYRWKYMSHTRFDGVSLGLFESNRLLAHYAGFPRTLQLPLNNGDLKQRTLGAYQIGDVMVNPDARIGIARNNRFARLTREYFATKLSPSCPVAFGFPNQRHLKLGQLSGLYKAIARLLAVDIRFTIDPHNRQSGTTEIQKIREDRFEHLIACATRSRLNWAFVVRSLEYWQWRFPAYRGYQWVTSELGLAILRREDSSGRKWHLLEWVCMPSDGAKLLQDCFQAIANAAFEQDPHSGFKEAVLQTWATRPCADELRNACELASDRASVGYECRELDVELTLNGYPNHDLHEILHERFWAISGDTDFL